MAISIVPGSAKISIDTKPAIKPVSLLGGIAKFTASDMAATGSVTFQGADGDDPTGWKVGWIQAEWAETEWFYFKGEKNSDGSMLLQRGATNPYSCRDTATAVGKIWSWDGVETADLPAGTFPQTVSAKTTDGPSTNEKQMQMNSLTNKPNFLAEGQVENLFCTILTVQDPTGTFHHQGSFYWNIRWQYRFVPKKFPPGDADWDAIPLAAGTGSNTSKVIMGPPSDKRFTGVLTSPQSINCLDLTKQRKAQAQLAGNRRKESKIWQSFDVRV